MTKEEKKSYTKNSKRTKTIIKINKSSWQDLLEKLEKFKNINILGL